MMINFCLRFIKILRIRRSPKHEELHIYKSFYITNYDKDITYLVKIAVLMCGQNKLQEIHLHYICLLKPAGSDLIMALTGFHNHWQILTFFFSIIWILFLLSRMTFHLQSTVCWTQRQHETAWFRSNPPDGLILLCVCFLVHDRTSY